MVLKFTTRIQDGENTLNFSSPEDIEKIADKYMLIKTGGTDCHTQLF